MARKTMIEAIRDAMDVMMERDDNVVVFGEDVGFFGGVFRCTQGLQAKYGKSRCFDAPINESGIVVDRTEVRRLTNAALMSRGRTVDERALGRSTELRLVRSWVGRGLVDALPFGSTLGRASVRAAARIDQSDLPGLVRSIRERPG